MYVLLLPYALFRWGSGREVVIGLGIILVAYVLGIASDYTGVVDAVVASVIPLFPAVLGAAVRYRTTARLRELDQVKLREREQLARELHDTVAHHVSAIAIRAQAGRVVAALRSRGRRRRARASSRTRPRARSPRCAAWSASCARARSPSSPPSAAWPTSKRSPTGSGTGRGSRWTCPATSTTSGRRSGPRSTASPRSRSPTRCGTPATPPASASRVAGDDDCVRLTVRDDGDASSTGRHSAGYGLVGMTERATLLGGTLEAGPSPDRGWTVNAVLPQGGPGHMTIRVLVADDQEIVRTGLRMILDAQPDIEVVGEAADGRAAVALARELRPDVCLFDIRMPDMDGIEATRQLAGPGVDDPLAVVVITTFDLDEYVHGALKAGARGFLLKDAGPELLVQAIHAAADGDALIAPKVTARLLAAFSDGPAGRPTVQPIEPLTSREEEVLLTVARGRTNAEIADELHISLSTVKTHLASLMAKLGARNRVEIVMWAYETDRVKS